MSQSFNSWKRDLLVSIYQIEERDGVGAVDLNAACENAGIDPDENRIGAFINEERGVLGEGAGVLDIYSFELNSTGREKAEQIAASRKPKSFGQRLKSVPRSDWIALGAFFVSLVALFKD